MTNPNHCAPRRGFLRSLATLPLIGGSVAVLGDPVASAAPITEQLLNRYDAWLEIERAHLRIELFGGRKHGLASRFELVWHDTEKGEIFDFDRVGLIGSGHRRGEPLPSTRAAVVLSAVGVDWR